MKRKRLLLTGASGFLGYNICSHAPDGWEIHGVYHSQPFSAPNLTAVKADLSHERQVRSLLDRVRPDAVIHAAALSDPNICQLNEALSLKVNFDASVHLARGCAALSVPCAFTSTDLVFDGSHAPYAEDDAPGPISVYGSHKVQAEQAMRDVHPHVLICRLPLMFGQAGPSAGSFLQPTVQALRDGRPLHLFMDEFRTPIHVEDVVRGLFQFLGETTGILHLGGPQRISRYDLGRLVQAILGTPPGCICPTLRNDVKMPAPRPRDVSLDSTRARRLGFAVTPLKEALESLIPKRRQ